MSPIYTPQNKAVSLKQGQLSEFEDLLKQSLRIYASRTYLFVVMAIVPFLLSSALDHIFNYANGLPGGMSRVRLMLIAAAFLLFVIAVLVYVYSQIIMMLSLGKKKNAPFSEILKDAHPLASKYLYLFVMVTLLLIMWTFLLVIPGIVFGVYYLFANYILVNEKIEGIEAIRRSKELVTGYWLQVAGKFILLILLNIFIAIIFGIPLMLMHQGTTSYALVQLALGCLTSLFSPIIIIFGYLLYSELRTIKK
ncbi:hypothetical protein HGA64_05555 [Candidatus Falkowbacteria bacterium]|nr:hypothetical protein [Candidatus Falkowbacteria bacterium]